MSKLRFKPEFWEYRHVAAETDEHLFDFRRMWKLAAFLTASVAVIPVIILAAVDYHVVRRSIEAENLFRTARLVSHTRQTIFSHFAERRSILEFIVKENTFESLNKPGALAQTLRNVRNSLGYFTDLGLIGPLGRQRQYVGPYTLAGKDYSDQEWYKKVLENSVYISDVFVGFRHVPHIVIAVKGSDPNGLNYVLRATLNIRKLDDMLSNIELAGRGDIFMINHQGTLQGPSRYHGKVFEKITLPVPKYAPQTEVFEGNDKNGVQVITGYGYITDTPFILMVVKHKEELMKSWYKTRMQLTVFLGISITIILFVVVGMTTYLVNKSYTADQKRIMTLHHVEYTNKMASIGRLAAGVAHEVNNPLAIINAKAGLIQDLMTYKKEYGEDPKLLGLVDSILSSVKRAGTITKRLLSFSQNMEVSIEPVNLKVLIEEALSFLVKEAEYRGIGVSLNVSGDVPQIDSDRGKLQEIFLNLINNAFAAMNDGGNLDIRIRKEDIDKVQITVADTGCGISKADMDRIFEPFFSTRTKKDGTGLGLSLTYNFVREMGGALNVESEVGKGTTFMITLPLKMQIKKGGRNESIANRR